MLIAGAKGFAKELLTIYPEVETLDEWVFFDNVNTDLPPLLYNKFTIVKSIEDATEYFKKRDKKFLLGVGNPKARFSLYNQFVLIGGEHNGLVSKNAIIGMYGNTIHNSVTIMPHVIIETGNSIQKGTLLHVGVFVSHDCTIGEFCEISPGANLLGNVRVGNYCSIGTNAILLPGVSIGNNVIIGAGAVVTKNIEDNMIAVGVPAKPVKKLNS